ncbi:MAG: hypothetical protein QXR53_04785 [Candidatus Norongarragalinales archaeon]
MKLASVLLLFALLFGAANALSLYSNADHVSIRGTEGKVYFWVVNTDGIAKTAAFNADLGELNGFFEDDGVIIPERGAKGTWLRFHAPFCFRGTERIEVNADVCDANGRCEVLRKTVLVAANPPEHCERYDDRRVATDSFVPPRSYGAGSLAWSNLVYSSYYDPTDFDAEISGSDYCVKIKPGESVRKPFSIINRGAASTFDLRTLGEESEVNSFVFPRSVSLRRGESEEVWVDLRPGWVEGGRHYVSLQVMRKGQVIAESPICVEIEDVFEAQVRLPSSVSGKQCEEIKFQGFVENKGTARDSFSLAVPRNSLATPDYIELNAGEKAVFSISIPANSLKVGENDFLVTAKSSAKGMVGQANLKVEAGSCAVAAPVKSTETRGDTVVELSVSVTNSFETPLKNVSAVVEGIPSSWKVESNAVGSIAPGESAGLSVKITQTTSEEAASPVLVVKSEGKEIGREPLRAIKPSGISGLFVGLSQNSLLVALLIIAALAVVVLVARRRQQETLVFKDAYRERLLSIKNAVESK